MLLPLFPRAPRRRRLGLGTGPGLRLLTIDTDASPDACACPPLDARRTPPHSPFALFLRRNMETEEARRKAHEADEVGLGAACAVFSYWFSCQL